MKISVVIPTNNRRVLVLRAIDSVLAQTVPVDEILVVDDASTDGTGEAVGSLFGASVKLFRQENGSAAAARNRGIREAQSEWIAFLDSDDVWLSTKIERQVEALGALGKSVCACFTDCQFVADRAFRKTAFELGGLEKHALFGVLENPVHYVLARHPVIYTPSLLVRKSLIKELGGFDEAMVIAEDTDLFLRLALKTNFCFVSEPLVKIDRTTSRPVPLTELFALSSDKMFSSKEHMFRKWLNMSDLGGPEVRAQIGERLRSLYYEWTISKFHQFRVGNAFAKMKQARAMGDSYLRILSKLAFRAARRLCAALTRQNHSPEEATL
jgi:glycosyltransferase involved in cell wall biosynthesis